MQTYLSSRLHVLRLAGVLLFGATSAAAQDHLVHDDAHAMQPAVATQLEQRLRHYADSTGVQLAVVTVASLHGQDIAQVGDSLKNAWGIGNKQTQRGILYLIAPSVPRQTIRTGRGIEADLPDALCFRILKQSQPTLRQDPQAAILSRVAGIQRELAEAARREQARAAEPAEVEPTPLVQEPDDSALFLGILLFSVGCLVLVAAFLIRTYRELKNQPPPKPAARPYKGARTVGGRGEYITSPRAQPSSPPSSISWGSTDDDDSSRKNSSSSDSSPWGNSSFGFGSDDSSSSGSSFSYGGDTDTGGGGASSD